MTCQRWQIELLNLKEKAQQLQQELGDLANQAHDCSDTQSDFRILVGLLDAHRHTEQVVGGLDYALKALGETAAVP